MTPLHHLLLLTLLPIIVHANYKRYNHTLARKLIFLATSAYSPTPNACLQKKFDEGELVQYYDIPCDISVNNTCSGYIALLHNEKAIAVVFRGTTTDDQMVKEGFAAFADKLQFLEMGRVNSYFFEAFEKLWKGQMGTKFEEVIKAHSDYDLWVTGHSLGGALANLASAYIVSTIPKYTVENSAHINFGQPTVGDKEYVESFKKLIPWYYRVTHTQDVIIDIYPKSLGFEHHGSEVWYNNTMVPGSSYQICELECVKNNTHENMEDHRHYFDINVVKYGRTVCVA
ncbi:unnamed protein product [Bursaphelenchus okinawaensis]|uniref:Fungal lipase-type domain-containing protein n=1 Tax=Bursaphelenchus okinawaensis TaxID=465554 RepID=A0A811LEW8_9BILA|nr:unnamed protein product [Bursaphelenchus okinawaensis]CAG9121923.1 unnamed protein product [Bursaphelenchus okinawaensis]